MQLASWLLLQRAVNNGELTSEQAVVEKTKVKLGVLASVKRGPGWDDLPVRLRDLIERSSRLQARLRRLDGALGQDSEISAHSDNAVHRQLSRIAEAFGAP
jgi:regulator of CtrA degradation